MGRNSNAKKNRPPKPGPYKKVPRVILHSTDESNPARMFGSDARQREPVWGICALCQAESVLLLSHIIPKWSYRWLKGEGGILQSRANGQIELRSQDGDKHYLLCASCEQYLGVAENYLRTVSVDGLTGLSKVGVRLRRRHDHVFDLIGINDGLMSRALYGIALKAHFAPTYYSQIPFPKLITKISEAILTDDYSKLPEHAFGFKWMGAEGMNARAHTVAELTRLRDNSISAHLKLAGIEWILPLTGELHESLGVRRWTILVGDIRGSALVFPEHWEDWDGEKGLPCCLSEDEDPCPCGTGLSYESCCKGIWCPANVVSIANKG